MVVCVCVCIVCSQYHFSEKVFLPSVFQKQKKDIENPESDPVFAAHALFGHLAVVIFVSPK